MILILMILPVGKHQEKDGRKEKSRIPPKRSGDYNQPESPDI
jgi:hypothetical protein